MWSKIIGIIFIISGVAFMLNPERLRRKIQRKGLRAVRRYIFAIAAAAGCLLISAGWQLEGAVAKILTVAGIILLLKGIFLLKAKSADIIAARLMKVPPLYLRLLAAVQIVLGIVLVMLLKK